MKSNKCLFSKAIFKSDIKRFLPFTIPVVIIYCIILPTIILSAGYNLPNDAFDMDTFMAFSIASDVFSFGFAGLFAVLLFSYLYKPNMCNAIHALPVGRRGLFITNFIAGYVLLVVPQITGFFIQYPAIHIGSHEPVKILLFGIGSIILDSFIYYSSGILAVMLAGNIFAGAAMYLLINFASTAIDIITDLVISNIGIGIVTDTLETTAFNYSPVGNIIVQKASYGIEAYAENGMDPITVGSILKTVLIYVAVSVVMIAVSYVIYKIRRLEVAGDMVAFKILNPVISVIVSFIGGAVLSMFICIFTGAESTGFLVMFAVFSFLAFIVAEMILHKTPKIFKLKNIVLWAVFCAVTVASFVLLANYKTNYIPKASEVEKMVISCTCDITLTDEKEIADAQNFHKALLEDEKKNTDRNISVFDRYDYIYNERDDGGSYTISIDYYFGDGEYISRSYWLREKNEKLCKQFRELEKNYPPEGIFDKLGDVEYEIVDCSCLPMKNGETSSVFAKTIPADKSAKILEECKKYSKEELKNYSSLNREYNEENYSMDEINQYEVKFLLRIKDGKQLSVINEVGYMSDPIGWCIEPEYDYDFKSGKTNTDVTFYLYCYVVDGSSLYDMIYSLDNAK